MPSSCWSLLRSWNRLDRHLARRVFAQHLLITLITKRGEDFLEYLRAVEIPLATGNTHKFPAPTGKDIRDVNVALEYGLGRDGLVEQDAKSITPGIGRINNRERNAKV